VDVAADDVVDEVGVGVPPAGRRRSVVIGLVLAAMGVLVGATLSTVAGSDESPSLLALDITVAVLGWAASPLLLWRPVAGSIGLTLLAAISPVATPPASLGALQVARRRRFPAAAAIAAAGVAAHAVQGWWRGSDGLPLLWWLVLVGLAYGALLGWGAWAQAREALVCSLRERAERAESEQGRRVAEARWLERTRIAREMHDVLAHRLSLLATYAGALEYRPDSSPEQLARAAGVVRASAHQALDELREVIGILRDDGTESVAGAGRPQRVLADLSRLVDESRAAGADIEVDTDIDDAAAVPTVAGRTAYRVVQEALTNARRHAAGQPVRVALRGGPGTQVTIEISNPMPAAGPAATVSGSGLVGLAERVQLAGGRLDHSAVDGEFRLRATLPWPA
jgi:signal transduction histidine kinase